MNTLVAAAPRHECSRVVSLGNTILRFFSPSSEFKNADCEDALQHTAVYRHNREQRGRLLVYGARWIGLVAALFAILTWLESSSVPNGFPLLVAATLGVGIALSFCKSVLLAYSYTYLCWVKE